MLVWTRIARAVEILWHSDKRFSARQARQTASTWPGALLVCPAASVITPAISSSCTADRAILLSLPLIDKAGAGGSGGVPVEELKSDDASSAT